MNNTQSVAGQWAPISNVTGEVPRGRSSNAAAVIDDKLYVFSGEHSPRAPVDGDVFALDIAAKTWQRYANASGWPSARVGHAGAVVDGKLYIYGGRASADGAQTMGDFWCFDPKQATTDAAWTRLHPEGTCPPPLSYHTMTSSDRTIYIFGGCTADHGRSNQLWAFDVDKQQWQQLTSDEPSTMPSPCQRGGASLVNASDGLHVLFGYNGKEEQRDHWLWDKTARHWRQLLCATGPAARSVTDVVYLPGVGASGSLFVFGGEFTPSAQGHEGAGSYHNDAWLFDLASQSWSQAGSGSTALVPSARGWFSTLPLSNRSVIVFGGFNGEARISDVHIWSASA